MKWKLSKKMLVVVLLVTLMGVTFACQGVRGLVGSPAEEAGPPEIFTLEPGPVLVVWPAVVSKKEGEVTISGSNFIPGDAVWIKIASADKDEQDVDLTKDLVKINDNSAFTITVQCKEALKDVAVKKRGVFVVKTVSGKQRAATAPIVINE